MKHDQSLTWNNEWIDVFLSKVQKHFPRMEMGIKIAYPSVREMVQWVWKLIVPPEDQYMSLRT